MIIVFATCANNLCGREDQLMCPHPSGLPTRGPNFLVDSLWLRSYSALPAFQPSPGFTSFQTQPGPPHSSYKSPLVSSLLFFCCPCSANRQTWTTQSLFSALLSNFGNLPEKNHRSFQCASLWLCGFWVSLTHRNIQNPDWCPRPRSSPNPHNCLISPALFSPSPSARLSADKLVCYFTRGHQTQALVTSSPATDPFVHYLFFPSSSSEEEKPTLHLPVF